MVTDDELRARWAREDDDTLLAAHFLGGLTAAGATIVRELLVARLGDLDAVLEDFRTAQGEVLDRMPVRRLTAGPASAALRGTMVFSAGGVGFIPAARFQEVDAVSELTEHERRVAKHDAATMLGIAAIHVAAQVLGGREQIEDRSSSTLPLPLLARVDRNALWIPSQPAAEFDWVEGACEFWRDGRRLCECEFTDEVGDEVRAWTDLVGWSPRSAPTAAPPAPPRPGWTGWDVVAIVGALVAAVALAITAGKLWTARRAPPTEERRVVVGELLPSSAGPGGTYEFAARDVTWPAVKLTVRFTAQEHRDNPPGSRIVVRCVERACKLAAGGASATRRLAGPLLLEVIVLLACVSVIGRRQRERRLARSHRAGDG